MSNGSNVIEPLVVGYYALTLMVFGTFSNLLTFVIFLRVRFRNTDERPTIHYMRAVAIVDIFMLYGWNLDHYLLNIYGYVVGSTSITACKLTIFINYFAPQVSAWLRVFVCLDRYLALSRLHRTWFGRSTNVLKIIVVICLFFGLFNLHIIVLACTYNVDGSISGNTSTYKIFPLWDWVHLAVYNAMPFVFMLVLNSGVIYHLLLLRRNSTAHNSRIQHRSISVTLVITTVLFVLLTIPPTVAYGFFYDMFNTTVLHTMDSLMYTYHIIGFPLYLLTFVEFRQEFINMICCRHDRTKVTPVISSTRTIRTI
jgi:hypothetical protein